MSPTVKLHVVHDAKGRIRAAALESGNDGTLSCKPAPGKGQKAVELELAADHRALGLDVLCTRFRIDTKGGLPRLVEDPQAARY